ncbi:MAG: tetratricopeptide repeat protein [Bacteroidota bacterium]|nr:tetratricopeptide repeat protein [Bacteroidota bacterium]
MSRTIIALAAWCTLLAAGDLRAQAADEINTLRLAQTYEQAGKHEDALRYFEDLLRQRPSNSGYFEGVRRCLTALKRYDAVLALLTTRIAEYPRDFSLRIHRGGLRMQHGRADSAEADWEAAIEMQTNNAQVYSMIADQLVNAREYRRAIEYLRRGRDALRSPQMYVFEIARAAAMNMDFETAMDEYLGYLVAAPQSLHQIQQQIAMFSEIPDALDAALRRARARAEDTPDVAALQHLLAWLYMERKEHAAAYQVTRTIDRLTNAGGNELISFATRMFTEGNHAMAAQAFGDAVAEHPRASFVPQAEFHRARCLEEQYAADGLPDALQPGDETTEFPSSEAVTSYDGAIRLYEQLAKKYAGQPVGSESLFRIAHIKFHRFGDADGALRILRDIADPRRQVFGKSDADILIGEILVARGDLDGAIAQYDRVLTAPRLDPALRRSVQYRIAESFFFAGALDTVLVLLAPLTADVGTDIANDALDLAALIAQYREPGERPLQQYAQSLLLERQRKYSEAAAVAADIIAQFGSHDIVDLAYLKQAALQRHGGQPRDAAETYEAFLSVRTESFLRDRGLFHLAELKEAELADPAGAMALYQQMLAEHPFSQFAARARERVLQLRKGHS